MALTEEPPPTVLPCGTKNGRPLNPASGSLWYIQKRLLPINRKNMAGMLTRGERSEGPASSASTLLPASINRVMTVQPADPAPMTI